MTILGLGYLFIILFMAQHGFISILKLFDIYLTMFFFVNRLYPSKSTLS